MSESDRTGSRISHYELVERLGVGSIGTTYRARDINTEQSFAIKVIHSSLVEDETFVAGITKAVDQAKRLSHEGIAKYTEVLSEGGSVFVVREYVEGTPISANLSKSKLKEKTAITLGIHIANCLQAIESAGLVNGRLKPDNIIVTKDKQVKITDFALPRPQDAASGGDEIQAALLEEAQYVAPEQIRSAGSLTAATDTYALGVILWRALTGKRAFEGGVPGAVFASHLTMEVDPARSVEASVSPATSDLVARMLNIDAMKRYTTWRDLLSDLRNVFAGRSPVMGEVARPAPQGVARVAPTETAGSGNGSGLYALSGILFVLAGLIAFLAIRPDTQGDEKVASEPKETITKIVAAKPSPVVKKSPKPVERVSSAKDRAILDLEKAIEFADENPDDKAGQIKQFTKVVTRYPGSLAAAKASKRIDALRKLLPSELEQRLANLKKKSDDLVSVYQYGAAIRLYLNPPNALRTVDVIPLLEEERISIEKAADEAFEEIKEKAASLAKEKKFAEARDVLGFAIPFGVRKITVALDDVLEDLDRDEYLHEQELARKKLDAYDKFRKSVQRALARRDFAEAIAQMENTMKDPACAEIADWVREDTILTQGFTGYWDKLVASLPQLVGKEFPVKRFPGVVDKVDGRTVFVTSEAKNIALGIQLERLRYDEVQSVLHMVSDTRSVEGTMNLATLLMMRTDYEEAQSKLAMVREKSPDTDLTLLESCFRRQVASYDRTRPRKTSLPETVDDAEKRAKNLVRSLRVNLRCPNCKGRGQKTRVQGDIIRTTNRGKPWKNEEEFRAKGGEIAGKKVDVECPTCKRLTWYERGDAIYYTTTDIALYRKQLKAIIDRFSAKLPEKLVKQSQLMINKAIVAEAFKYSRNNEFNYRDVIKNPTKYAGRYFFLAGRMMGQTQDSERERVYIMKVKKKVAVKDNTTTWSGTIEARVGQINMDAVPPWYKGRSHISVCAKVIGLGERDGHKIPKLEAMFIHGYVEPPSKTVIKKWSWRQR